jgi:hypothetical protein
MFAPLILLWAAGAAAAGQAASPPAITWASATAEDDRFWINTDGISTQYYPSGLTVWVHGEHGRNHNATYKTSLQHIHFYCDGNLRLIALTTSDSAGHPASDWHGAGTIRPIVAHSVYDDIEKALCPR